MKTETKNKMWGNDYLFLECSIWIKDEHLKDIDFTKEIGPNDDDNNDAYDDYDIDADEYYHDDNNWPREDF